VKQGENPKLCLSQDRYKQGEKKSKNNNLIAFPKLDNSTNKKKNVLVFQRAFALACN
jgi:hypothetical protein